MLARITARLFKDIVWLLLYDRNETAGEADENEADKVQTKYKGKKK